MAEVLRSPSHFPSSPGHPNDGSGGLLSHSNGAEVGSEEERRRGGGSIEGKRETRREREGEGREEEEELQHQQRQQLSVLALLLTVFRKSLVGCKTEGSAGDEDFGSMEIGCPTDVRHVAHVTFDRFHGFLGLPAEFEPEVPRRAPSASATVFGVSAESMQCSFDSRGNSVPTILLLMQRRLYEQGGLEAEGVFRINAENSQEEYVRDQLNNGVVPDGIDVHCLAGLIKAWFRELPAGLLDSLSYEQVMLCQTEEDCSRLASLLLPTEAALLDWAINLMVDVVQEEQQNKMNARNIATVFAPNMTQMSDPLTALMYAVQVMNFLRMLILKTLKERQESTSEDATLSNADPSDENGHRSPHKLHIEACSEELAEQVYVNNGPVLDGCTRVPEEKPTDDKEAVSPQASLENAASAEGSSSVETELAASSSNAVRLSYRWKNTVRSSSTRNNHEGRKVKVQATGRSSLAAEKSKRASIVSRINSKVERVEAWR